MTSENTSMRRAVMLALAAAAGAGGAAALAADTATTSLEVIVVTGSRIQQDKYSSSVPIDVISPEQQTARGVADIAGALQTATVAAGSPQVTTASSSIFVENGGIGTQTLSLRGLGADRTLVLLNSAAPDRPEHAARCPRLT